jgi:serine/threonine-protein kinase
LESVIGTGGMGIVYRATHIHLDSQFAVKVLNPDLVANQSAIERFRREAKAAGRIQHPNAIKVTDFGVTPERLVYLVMEIVNGQSLREMIYQEGAFEYRRAVKIARQICAAVEAAHHSEVIHRDLKPDNILIDQAGHLERVKVLDFGIAKLKEKTMGVQPGLTQAGTIIGTPQYMSPEQCQGHQLDPRSDIYSIGIILYEMLCGYVPLDADSAIQVVVKQLHEAPRPLHEVAPQVPEPLANVVMRTIEKNPDLRPSSAAELGAELKQAAEAGESSSADSITDSLLSYPVSKPSSEIRLSEGRKTPSQQSSARSGASGEMSGPAGVPSPPSVVTVDSQTLTTSTRWPRSIRALIAAVAILVAGVIGYLLWPSPSDQQEKTQIQPLPGMVLISGGKFMMGRNDGDEDERPMHEVIVKDFYLDQYEVTNERYKEFVDKTSHKPPAHWVNGTYPIGQAKFPVMNVTWDDAVKYAQWAGKRLPTEEEWEYVARNGSKQDLYPWGKDWKNGLAAVHIPNRIEPFAVGSFVNDKNEFGVYDLVGNVSEWVADDYHFYDGSKVEESGKVFRGGNFFDQPRAGTYRYYATYAELADPSYLAKRGSKIGFRCAQDIKR